MKTALTFLFNCLALYTLTGQITVTNAVFPAAGDTLRAASDFTPEGITVTATGGPYTWDLTSLSADTRYTTVFQPAANGSASAAFPSADLVIISDVGTETYYDVSATAVSSLGFNGGDFSGLPFATTFVFTPPLAELNAPMTFPNVYSGQTTFGFSISTDEIPTEILDSLGIPTALLDSIRLRINTERNDFVDAYGTMMIPGGTYEVLRQKRTDVTETRLEIHTFLGWQDVTDLFPLEGFGETSTVSYSFISNTEKLPIAILNMDTTGLVVASVDFKDNGAPSALQPADRNLTRITVTPNPGTHLATFDLQFFPEGDYTIHLYDSSGQWIRSTTITKDYPSVQTDDLQPGLYFYQIADQQRVVVAAGKWLKVNR